MLDQISALLAQRARSYQTGVQTTVCWKANGGWQNALTKLEFIRKGEEPPRSVVHEYNSVAIYRRLLPTHAVETFLRRSLAESVLETGAVGKALPYSAQFSPSGSVRRRHSEWSSWPADVFSYQPVPGNQLWPPADPLIALDAPYFPSLNQVLSEFFAIRSHGWTNYLQGQMVIALPDFRARISHLSIALAHLRAELECVLLSPEQLVAKVYAENQIRRLVQATVPLRNSFFEFDLADKPSFASVALLCAETGDVLDERVFQAGVLWLEPGVIIEDNQPDIEQMLLTGESETIEFRQKLDRSRPERLAKTAVAFANTKGGTIVFGVDDDHRAVGCEIKGMADDLTNIIRSYCDPPPVTRSRTITHQGKELFLLEISESKDSVHVVKDQGLFIRANGTNRSPTAHELEVVIRSRRDSLPPSFQLPAL